MSKRARRIRLASKILVDSREELSRADGKASLLLAAIAVAVGALLAALLADQWSPSNIDERVQWLWWSGLLSVAVGIGALGFSVFPRTKYRGAREPGVIGYFGDVINTPRDNLVASLDATDYEKALLDQVVAIAWVVDRKYRSIQLALWSLGLGAGALLVSVLVNRAIA